MPQTFPVPVVPGCHVWPWRWRVALLAGLALSLGLANKVRAATTWTVCASGCDYSRIKAAVAAPTTLDGDTLAIAAGVYTEAGITVNKSLTLQGEDADTTTVQAAATRATATDRVFTIPRGVTVTLQGLTIQYGQAPSSTYPANHGGGLYNQGSLTLMNSTIRNSSAMSGGGLYSYLQSRLTLINSIISGNSAHAGGGGLLSLYGAVTLTNSTVSGNSAGTDGGGLYNLGGTMALTTSTVSGNSARLSGGGLANSGTLTLTHSNVSGNNAPYGGGVYTAGSPAALTNSTVSNNSAGKGGGLYNGGTLTLTHSTVSGNFADSNNGGELYIIAGTVTLTSSIVAKNQRVQGENCRNAGSGSLISHGYNLDSDGSCQLTAPTDRPGTEPLLGSLRKNGGRTFTRSLRPGSPAIDAIPWGSNDCGTTFVSDQRWRARPQPAEGPCDIGAYEVKGAGQALGGWVSGFTPHTVVCQNVTSRQSVTLSDPTLPLDCEAAGVGVSSGDQVALRVQGPVEAGATDVGGAVVGMVPNAGSCTNLTTGQQVQFQALFQGIHGATAASCTAVGLVAHPGETVQMRVQGGAE